MSRCYLCGFDPLDPKNCLIDVSRCGIKDCPMRGPKIVTQDQYFGWIATTENYNGPGSPIGIGKTEQQAIDDLKEILADREERKEHAAPQDALIGKRNIYSADEPADAAPLTAEQIAFNEIGLDEDIWYAKARYEHLRGERRR